MPRSVAVLLFPEFSNHCLANAVEPLRAANSLSGMPLYSWQYLSPDGAPVMSSSGLPVQPDAALRDHAGADYLLLMPSYGHSAHVNPAMMAMLRQARRRFGTLVGLDTGSWLLAAAGLLDGYRATIHWDEFDRFSEAFPDVEVVEDRFVIDRDRASCGGTSTALDLMLELIQHHHGGMLRLEVAALFMLGERDPKNEFALPLNAGALVEAAAAIMRRNIEEPLPLAEVAARLGLGLRALEIQFRTRLGRSPRSVYTSIRLRAAKRMVEATQLPIAEIAGRTGYQDKSAMTRAFKAEFGVPPSGIRRHIAST